MTTSIKNLTKGKLDFPVPGGTQNNPRIETIGPGEIKALPLKADNPLIVGRVHAGLIEVGTKKELAAAHPHAPHAPKAAK